MLMSGLKLWMWLARMGNEMAAHDNLKRRITHVIGIYAKEGRTLSYQELGEQVGKPAQGPWKAILDEIGLEEGNAGRPDITYLVVSKRTGFPSQIDFKDARRPTAHQKARAREEWRRIWDLYKAR